MPLKEKIVILVNKYVTMSNNKKDKKIIKDVASKTTISVIVKDHSKDPFVVKKVEASTKIVGKYGFPKELING